MAKPKQHIVVKNKFDVNQAREMCCWVTDSHRGFNALVCSITCSQLSQGIAFDFENFLLTAAVP